MAEQTTINELPEVVRGDITAAQVNAELTKAGYSPVYGDDRLELTSALQEASTLDELKIELEEETKIEQRTITQISEVLQNGRL